MSQRNITFLLPGYTPGVGNEEQSPKARSLPPGGSDSAFFSFTEDLERQPWQAQLADLAAVDSYGGRRLPGAQLTLSPDDELQAFAAESSLVRADPISLKADRDSASLIPPELLKLTAEESTELLGSINTFLADDQIQCHSRQPAQWYLSGMPSKDLATYPPSFLANRNASTFLPDGQGAAPWRRLMTELQMLLHTHPVNTAREQRGLPPVNSVWFWGGAPMPATPEKPSNAVLYADDDTAGKWAEVLGIECRSLTELSEAIMHPADTDEHSVALDLTLINAWLHTDHVALTERLEHINAQWLQPACQQVKNAQCAQVSLLTEDSLQGVCNRYTLKQQSAYARANTEGWLSRLFNAVSQHWHNRR